MLAKGFLLLANFLFCFSQKIVTDYPTLPTLWEAETIEPGHQDLEKALKHIILLRLLPKIIQVLFGVIIPIVNALFIFLVIIMQKGIYWVVNH